MYRYYRGGFITRVELRPQINVIRQRDPREQATFSLVQPRSSASSREGLSTFYLVAHLPEEPSNSLTYLHIAKLLLCRLRNSSYFATTAQSFPISTAQTKPTPPTNKLSFKMDDLLQKLLTFPPHPPSKNPLSDSSYEEGIKSQIAAVGKISEKNLLLSTAGGESPLDVSSSRLAHELQPLTTFCRSSTPP